MGERHMVVTGASTGIGRAVALDLGRQGFVVHAGVRRPEDAESLIAEGGGNLRALIIDVTDEAQVRAAALTVAEAVGAAGLAGLINNAGIAVTGPVEFASLDDWRRQYEVNVFGAIAVIQAFLPLVRRGGGRVVNIGSIAGRNALPFAGPYSSSKHALEAITDSLRMEVQPFGIHVSIIEPGAIDTPIWEKGNRGAMERVSQYPPQAFELYGPALAVFSRAALRNAAHARPVAEVVKAVNHALSARRPRTRYLVGREARIQAAVSERLPDRLRDRLLARFIGLPGWASHAD